MIGSAGPSSQIIEGGEYLSMWISLAGILVAVIFGTFLIVSVRRWYRRQNNTDQPGFSLQELRRMQREGSLSQEEFDSMRKALLSALNQPRDEQPQSDGTNVRE